MAGAEGRNDFGFVAHHAGEVEADGTCAGKTDAQLAEVPPPRSVVGVRGVEKTFGGNAADVETRPPERLAGLDAHHFHALLGSAKGGCVPAWTSPDHCKVVVAPLLRRHWCCPFVVLAPGAG